MLFTFAEAADVTINIDEVPDSVVGAALYPAAGESAAFIRHAAQIAKARQLSVFAPDAAIRDAEDKALIESLPTTVVIRPSKGVTLRGSELLSATARETIGPFDVGVSKVDYQLTGGDLGHMIIGHARSTLFGWIALWDTTTVANGSYILRSVAPNSKGKTTESIGVAVVVRPSPL